MSRFFYGLTAVATTVFVITILALVAMVLGDPDAPVNEWFNRHATVVLEVEVAVVIVLGLSAMFVDRRETQRRLEMEESDQQVIPVSSSDE